MTSSSCDSDEEIGWWKTKNLINERLIDDSLIHTLKRVQKLKTGTRRTNASLRKYVKKKLRDRRQSLNSSNKYEHTLVDDNSIATDSESSGVDDVFITDSKPSTSAKSRHNHSATSKHSSLKNVRARSMETEKIRKRDSLPKIVNDNYTTNRSANTDRVLRSTTKRLQVSSLSSANQQDTNLSHEVNNLLSDRSSLTPPINKLNGVFNRENDKNNVTNSKKERSHMAISIKLNISSEEILDPIRKLPKGPATIKKNLFNTVKNNCDDSEDISRSIERLPANDSIKSQSFHEDKSITKDSDLLHEKSNIDTCDTNNLPEELKSDVKLQDKNAESSKAECLNDIQNSVLVSKPAAKQNSFEEMKSPTHSLSMSQSESVSGDDSIRTRFVPRVKSNKILKTRYKIVKLHEEGKDVSHVRPLITSSPNTKSLHHHKNTVDEISKETDKKLKDPESTRKIQDNHNVCEGLDESSFEERNNSYTAANINHLKENYDSCQENLECLNVEEQDLPITSPTLNINTNSQFQETPNSTKILHEEVSDIEHQIDRIDERNSSNLEENNEAPKTKVTSDLEIDDDSNLSPNHPSNSNRILSNSVTEIESLRCVMKKLNTQKEKYDVNFMKEYEDQFLKKREQQSLSESINNVHNQRPVKIQDVAAQSNFTQESSVTSLTMNDISLDDEIFIFEIPKTVDVHNFRDKTFMFQGDNEIVIGEEKFEVYERESRSMSIVLNKGDLERSYGAVNLKAVRSVYIRPKMLNAEIEAHEIDKEEKIPKSSKVPFPKNLRSRHPLLGCSFVTNKASVPEEKDEIDVTSKKVLKWLTSQNQHDNEDPVTNGRRTEEEMKSREKITDKDDEDVTMRFEKCDDDLASTRKKSPLKSKSDKHKLEDYKMQNNFTEAEEVKKETYNKSSPRKKTSGLSDAFNETVTTHDDMLSRDIKLKKKLKKKKHETVDKPKRDKEPDSETLKRKLSMGCNESDSGIQKLKKKSKKKKHKTVDKPERDNKSDSETLKRKSSMNCNESDSGIQKKKFKTSLDFSGDNIILTQGETEFVKSDKKVKLDYKMEIREKQLQVDTEVTKDEVNDRFGLEASEENSKRKIKKCKRHKKKRIKDFYVSTGTEEYVFSPERINQDILSSTLKAHKEQRRMSGCSAKEKISFFKKVKHKIQLDRNASSKSSIEKLNVTIESCQEEDQSYGSKSSKKKKNKHVCLKDILQQSYPPKLIPTLSPKRRCHSFSKFESKFESESSMCKEKKYKLNLTDVDDAKKEDKSMNLENFMETHKTPLLKKYKEKTL